MGKGQTDGDAIVLKREDWFEFLSLKVELAALRFLAQGLKVRHILTKANFDPNQPRVPAGHSDGGEWTDAGAGGREQDGTRDEPVAPSSPRLYIAIWPSNGGPPLIEDPPRIPPQPPASRGQALRVARVAATWVARAVVAAAAAAVANPIVAALAAVGVAAGSWLYDSYGGYISSYLEGPKSLAELQADVSTPRQGTDVHHIVEQGPASAEGFPRHLIDGSENLVRISTFKHWEINGAYSRFNFDLGMSPRDYLRNKSWQERHDFGVNMLKDHGVLLP
ncbi:hypothetical protein ACLBXM_21810 [Xanthobacteraceae bacterium A53D]